MIKRRSKRRWLRPVARVLSQFDQVPGFLLLTLGVLVVTCGIAGFSVQLLQSTEPRSLAQMLYMVAQLFVLESGAEGPDNVWLKAARTSVVVLLVLGLIKVLTSAWQETAERLRLWGLNGHYVICGLGRIGMQLARDLAAGGKARRVVVIERDENNPQIPACRELGAIVLTGDATSDELLERAGASRAERMFAVCGSDSTNVETAVRVFRHEAANKAILQCYVHITDLKLAELFRQHPVFRDRTDKVEVTIFNVLNNTARHLIRNQLAHDSLTEKHVAHYVLFGFGEMGQSFALSAANLAHYANLKRLRMTIIDEHMALNRDQFNCRYPRFCPEPGTLDLSKAIDDSWTSQAFRPAPPYRSVYPEAVEYACNAEFLAMPADVESDELTDRLTAQFSQPNVVSAVIICYDDDRRNFETAVRLRAKLSGRAEGNDRIFAWLPEQSGLAELLTAGPSTSAQATRSGIVPFGQREATCNLREVSRPESEEWAKAFHQVYHDQHDPHGKLWPDLEEPFRASCRWAADHIDIKLAAVGCKTYRPKDDKASDNFSFAEDEVELLARMEHNRWLGERLIDGWSYAKTRDNQRKQRPGICPWEHLDEKQDKEKDRDQVRSIPAILAKTGLRIRRTDA